MGIISVAGILTALCCLIGNGRSDEVCYPDVGCFTDEGCHADAFPPLSPEEVNTRFFLYTRRNPQASQELITGDVGRLRASFFDPKKPTKFSVHGWNGNSNGGSERDRKDAFLETEDVNVIMVDWRAGAAGVDYWNQHQNARVAGRQLSLMARFLNLEKGMYYKDVHIVGHSLGAHVSGYAGEFQPGFGRITGTDPAGPLFKDDGPECRLDRTDALYVDAIHVDGNQRIGLGIDIAVGHQDFYPNGGMNQPACGPGQDIAGCSHGYSNRYFAESIRSTTCNFTARPCPSMEQYLLGLCDECGPRGCSEMGYHSIDHDIEGTFVLETNAESPYCITYP